ncbi:glycoside hydrolase family 32 protein [Streptomyces mirabilis]|uniref:glycoside hydrolase family 32 protein n=1 Tax=Streptomyces mirabilis TaxID=68239 RepID=UPI0036865964
MDAQRRQRRRVRRRQADRCVWQQDDSRRMLVGAALADGRGAALLYGSDDLEKWACRGPFHTSSPTATTDPGGWECPPYATFGDHSVLILSDWTPQDGPSHVTVHTGREEEGRFTAPAPPVPLDHGPDFYAPALLKAPEEGRWLLWGWSWEARDDAWAHEAGWAGALTPVCEWACGQPIPEGAPRGELGGLAAAGPSRGLPVVSPRILPRVRWAPIPWSAVRRGQGDEISRITSPQGLPSACYGSIFERCESGQREWFEKRLPDPRASHVV